MADLGTLSTPPYLIKRRIIMGLDVWANGAAYQSGTKIKKFKAIPTAAADASASGAGVGVLDLDRLQGAISGNVVALGGSGIPNARVVVLDGRTFLPVAWALTDANGAYSFPKLSRLSGDYIVLVRHPAGTEKAEVFDKIDAL